MRSKRRAVLWLGAMPLLCVSTAVARAPEPADLLACGNIQDNFARLACYDRLNPPRAGAFAQPGAVPEAAPSASATTSPSPPAMAPAPAVSPSSPVTPPAPSVAAAAPVMAPAPAVAASPPAPVVSSNPEAQFGLSPKALRARASADGKKGLDKIQARVTSVSERPRGELLLKLDNGQIWTQTERRFGTVIREGDTVTIARGVLGSFMLTSQAGVSTRVRRVE